MVCFCLHPDVCGILSNASHNTDSYNSVLSYTLCHCAVAWLTLYMYYIVLILIFNLYRWILLVSHHHADFHNNFY